MRLGLGLGLGATAARIGEAAPALTVPEAPTIGVATAGDGEASVTFTRNGDGGSAVLDSTVTPYTEATWSTTAKRAEIDLSNGNLTASTDYDALGGLPGVISTLSHTDGKQVVRFQFNFDGDPSFEEIYAGFATTAYDPTDLSWQQTEFLTLATDGTIWAPGVDFEPSGTSDFADGDWMYVWRNGDTGKIWFGKNGVPQGDPEAGTGEALTFTPGQEHFLLTIIYLSSIPGPTSTVVDPTLMSGTFKAWNDVSALAATGASSPIVVPVPNGNEYTFTVHDRNAIGNSPESAASNAVTPEAAGASTTWDPAAKSSVAVLSNGDLTVTTTDNSLSAMVRSTTTHDSGKRAFELTLSYPGADTDWETQFGVAASTWDSTDGAGLSVGFSADSWGFTGDGGGFHNDFNPIATGLPTTASGGKARVLVDFDAGKIWLGNESSFGGNPEAGTGAALTFTPNTPLYIAGSLYAYSTAVSEVLNADYSSGTFAAWNA